ncbi:hypothetical protein KFK09_000781 [Dendrobium nobile]|uniref:Uncharacterized protein n=1 Tax=Dendrobium nobile TaxID=94219 RepID=A0A8T3C9J4_DENNO|nr:hypothetical protein KFK09_000781 [Dendrobium nobile]
MSAWLISIMLLQRVFHANYPSIDLLLLLLLLLSHHMTSSTTTIAIETPNPTPNNIPSIIIYLLFFAAWLRKSDDIVVLFTLGTNVSHGSKRNPLFPSNEVFVKV